jgi:hypothetical protein
VSEFPDYTGYVYLWYDTRAKLFYLGGHFGKVEDSYVCSSFVMKRAYKIRPETFKMKVLEYSLGGVLELRAAEQRWLNMIKDVELLLSVNVKNGTARYYNVKKNAYGGGTKKQTEEQRKKSSESHKGLIRTEEHRQNLSRANMGKRPSDLCIKRAIECRRARAKPPKHGTRYMYCKFACRCDLCRKAHCEYAKGLYERKKQGSYVRKKNR